MRAKKPLSTEEQAARYQRRLELHRQSYARHAEKRREYQRKRYKAMMDALRAKRGNK